MRPKRSTSLSRRNFLKAAASVTGLAAIAPGFAAHAIVPSESISGPLYDCVIIGGGIAGVTAANRLSRAATLAGQRLKILVVEGSERLGGRMHTLRGDVGAAFGGSLELGCEYLHVGRDKSEIWTDIDRFGLATREIPKILGGYVYDPTEFSSIRTLFWGGTHYNVRMSADIFPRLRQVAAGSCDLSAASFLKAMGGSAFERHTADLILGGHLPGALDRLSLKGFVSDRIEDQMVEWNDRVINGGYDLILQRLASEVEPKAFVFGERVSAVRPMAGGGALVGLDGRGWCATRSVICTASIGALKDRQIDFGPFWTARKEASLRFIGANDHSKISVRFKERFWPPNMTMLHDLDPQARRSGRTFFVPNTGDETKPPVLTSYLTDGFARAMRDLSNEQALRLICADLDQMFPDHAPTYNKVARYTNDEPIMNHKRWREDPFARGGLSFLEMGEPVAGVDVTTARAALADASQTRPVFWAGEATAVGTQPGSVHGAFATGVRAASEILRFLAEWV